LQEDVQGAGGWARYRDCRESISTFHRPEAMVKMRSMFYKLKYDMGEQV
jgi:hypothetical protein